MRSLAELHKAAATHTHPDVVYGAMIPDPDYSDDEHLNCSQLNNLNNLGNKNKGSTTPAAQSANMVARNNRNNSTEGSESPKCGSPQLSQKENNRPSGNNRFDENGLVLPKKLVNPSLDSTEKKSLHRELLFNQKAGVSVLNQKSELQKAMEKHKDKKIAKEKEIEKQANLSPFQKALEQQALKLEQNNEKVDDPKKEPEGTHEFQKLHAKLRSKLEAQWNVDFFLKHSRDL